MSAGVESSQFDPKQTSPHRSKPSRPSFDHLVDAGLRDVTQFLTLPIILRVLPFEFLRHFLEGLPK